MNNRWNQWVLGYNPERQREILTRLGFGDIDWRGMTAAVDAVRHRPARHHGLDAVAAGPGRTRHNASGWAFVPLAKRGAPLRAPGKGPRAMRSRVAGRQNHESSDAIERVWPSKGLWRSVPLCRT